MYVGNHTHFHCRSHPPSLSPSLPQLGPGGYVFLVDNNGQLITHPQINSTYLSLLSSDDLISLDISNYEHVYNKAEFIALREAIINRASGVDNTTGTTSLSIWATVEREGLYQLKNVTYFYAPVSDTPFAIVLVLPNYSFETFHYPTTATDDDLGYLIHEIDEHEMDLDEPNIGLESRPFCSWGIDPQKEPICFLSTLVNLVNSCKAGFEKDCHKLNACECVSHQRPWQCLPIFHPILLSLPPP